MTLYYYAFRFNYIQLYTLSMPFLYLSDIIIRLYNDDILVIFLYNCYTLAIHWLHLCYIHLYCCYTFVNDGLHFFGQKFLHCIIETVILLHFYFIFQSILALHLSYTCIQLLYLSYIILIPLIQILHIISLLYFLQLLYFGYTHLVMLFDSSFML